MASKTMVRTPSTNGMPRPGLGRQGSNIFSLTLEEFQNEHGKIGSMNMEEFLKNVWTAEEGQAMVSAMAGGEAGAGVSQNPLQRQASLCNVPPSLGDKTVEEVWKEIQAQKQQQQQQQQQHQDVSFGEMTLEDFLVRAGVVKEDIEVDPGTLGPQGTMEMPQSQQQQAEWINYQMKQQQLLHQQAEAAAYVKRSPVGNLILPTGPAGGAYFDGAYDGGALTPASLALSPGIGTADTPSKKRNIDLVVEKTVERRQRRMIKNRESAARSRARKQAYTVELEAEVQQLKDENTRLKRWQAGEAERRRKQIMEVFLPVTQQRQQHQQRQQQRQQSRDLRRTRSFP